MSVDQDQRERFAAPDAFAWHQRAGLDALLNALAAGDAEKAEKITWNLYRQAAYVEARRGGGDG